MAQRPAETEDAGVHAGPARAADIRLPGMAVLRRVLPPDENIVLARKPHPLFIVLWPLGKLSLILAAWLASRWAFALVPARALPGGPASLQHAAMIFNIVALVALLLVLLWSALEWWLRVYVMTDRRALSVTGVIRQVTSEVPLESVRHVVLAKSVRERIFGLGSLGFASAGTGGIEVAWIMLAAPNRLLEAARRELPAPAIPGGTRGSDARRPLVIGLAGGVGSGKSEAARAFARLGCLVSDSDAEAKAALERPEVRDEIVRWWGEGVLDEDGRPDRRRIAAIVFADESERKRLEALVHPIVHRARAAVLEEARRRGAPAVIIDAPLLFEAGVDRECDVVVFVEAPRQTRLARVQRTRGWDEADFDRRERVQWPTEEKRRRSHAVLNNDDPPTDLSEQARSILERFAKNRRAD